MDIDEQKNDEGKNPKYRTTTGHLEEVGNVLLVFEDGPDPVGQIKLSEIESISIKAAGALYDGEVVFRIKGGSLLKFKIKQYQQEDFEELIRKTGK